MIYIVETKTMAIMEFSRTSLLTGKMLNTMIAQKGLGTFAVRMTSIAKSGDRGNFFSPVVSSTTIKVDELKHALAEAQTVK
jgi:hypothetical protein